MILLMGLNIVIVPMAIIILIYLINKRSLMGRYKANAWRNLFLVASLCLSLWLAASKLPGYAAAIF
jgi:Mn2+/Fe2+ NRAMP family transporter